MTHPSIMARERALEAKQVTRNPLTGQTPEEQQQLVSLRKACLNAVTEADIQAIMAAQIQKAKDGDNMAAKFVYERVFGLPMRFKDVQIQINKTSTIKKLTVDLTNLSDADLAALEGMRRKVEALPAPEIEEAEIVDPEEAIA
jgi:hypothetical protein